MQRSTLRPVSDRGGDRYPPLRNDDRLRIRLRIFSVDRGDRILAGGASDRWLPMGRDGEADAGAGRLLLGLQLGFIEHKARSRWTNGDHSRLNEHGAETIRRI